MDAAFQGSIPPTGTADQPVISFANPTEQEWDELDDTPISSPATLGYGPWATVAAQNLSNSYMQPLTAQGGYGGELLGQWNESYGDPLPGLTGGLPVHVAAIPAAPTAPAPAHAPVPAPAHPAAPVVTAPASTPALPAPGAAGAKVTKPRQRIKRVAADMDGGDSSDGSRKVPKTSKKKQQENQAARLLLIEQRDRADALKALLPKWPTWVGQTGVRFDRLVFEVFPGLPNPIPPLDVLFGPQGALGPAQFSGAGFLGTQASHPSLDERLDGQPVEFAVAPTFTIAVVPGAVADPTVDTVAPEEGAADMDDPQSGLAAAKLAVSLIP